jgi:predicted DCC family thiol-disulfide oxidoreductase YuxK
MDKNFNTPLLLFDHECQLCVRFIQSLERIHLEQEINMVSVHEPGVYQKYTFLDKQACLDSIHLVIDKENEQVLVGEEAVEYLISLNPQIKKFTWLIESKMGQKAISFFYHAANKYRESLLNRCSGCRNKG